jgi:hypothetical protein
MVPMAITSSNAKPHTQETSSVSGRSVPMSDPSQFIRNEAEAQEAHAQKVATSNFDYTVVVAGAFVRGMRNVGYKSAGSALNELNDNAYQAGASRISVWMKMKGQKVEAIAVIDDGHGMSPEAIRLAMLWGGTHREGSRDLFGRFGFGLPSASVSIGRRFSVYSKPSGGEWNGGSFDLDAVERNEYTDPESGRIVMPKPGPAALPSWVIEGIKHKATWGATDLEHGTVVMIEVPDQLRPVTITALSSHFKQTFGLVYRNYCVQRPIFVQGEKVTAVDPLFLTPGAWAFDYDDQRARELDPVIIDMPNKETGEPGQLTVRFSYMPYTFLRLDPKKPKEKGQRNNPRFQVADQNNGLIIMRASRQLDVVSTSRGQDSDIRSKFFVNNDDRTWAIEVDFTPTLDDEFSVTTSKQGVKMSSRIWKALEDNNVFAAIREMRKWYDQEKADFKKAQEEEAEAKRGSEEAMEEEAKTSHEDKSNPDKERRQREGFEKEAGRRAKESGMPADAIKPKLKEETESRPWLVTEETLDSTSTFYRLELVGGQKKLWINKGHRFYSQVYAGPESTPLTRAQWEIFLFILGDAEISGSEELRTIYEGARVHWSSRFNAALAKLVDAMPAAEPVDPDGAEEVLASPPHVA